MFSIVEYFPVSVERYFSVVAENGYGTIGSYSPKEMKQLMISALEWSSEYEESAGNAEKIEKLNEKRPVWYSLALHKLMWRAFSLYRIYCYEEKVTDEVKHYFEGSSVEACVNEFVSHARAYFIQNKWISPGVERIGPDLFEVIYIKNHKRIGTAVFYYLVLYLIYGKEMLSRDGYKIGTCRACGKRFVYQSGNCRPRAYCSDCRGPTNGTAHAQHQKQYRLRKKAKGEETNV